jgi:hypothetical protein
MTNPTIRPMFGRGPAKPIPSRRDHTPDIFGHPTEDEVRGHNALKCEAIVQFLNGERSRMEVLPTEFGEQLGSDDFDQKFAAAFRAA